MNAPAGWYPDTQRAPGHLRYWDGQRWTEHRHVLPGPTAPAGPPAAAAPRWVPAATATQRTSGGWVRRHKVATAALAVVGLALVGSALPDESDPVAAGVRDTAEESGAGSSRDGAGDGSDRSEAPEEEPPAGERQRDKGDEVADRAVTDRNSSAPTVAKPRAKPRAKPGPKPRPALPRFVVTRVVDGDTVELGNGETVRLVGIDTPEVGECGFEPASAALADLVLGRTVTLGTSDEDRDGYGRLLRYVDVGRVDAGLRLIRQGRAIAAYDSRDGYGFHPREPRYVAGDRGSRNLCPMQTGQPVERERPAPAPTTAPKPQPLMGGSGGGGARSCAAGYSPCLPRAADLDCADVSGPVRVTGSDPYRLDADGDGVGCDS